MMVGFSRWSIKVKGLRWRQWSLRTSRYSPMGTPSLVWRSIEPMGKRNSSWSPKKRSSLSRCINANTKSHAGNKKILKLKPFLQSFFKEIMGKGGHGNPHLFPVNQILNLKIKYLEEKIKIIFSKQKNFNQSICPVKQANTNRDNSTTYETGMCWKKKIYGLVGLVHIAYRSHSNWREKLCANCAGGSHLPDNFKEWGYFTTYFNPPTSI